MARMTNPLNVKNVCSIFPIRMMSFEFFGATAHTTYIRLFDDSVFYGVLNEVRNCVVFCFSNFIPLDLYWTRYTASSFFIHCGVLDCITLLAMPIVSGRPGRIEVEIFDWLRFVTVPTFVQNIRFSNVTLASFGLY